MARLKETVELCSRMGYRRIGLAFCRGLRKEAKVVADLLRSRGFEVVSVICKTGGISKEEVGLAEDQKVHPGQFESMCNPIAQAKLLNEQKTEFNIALGLCVGHDSLFYKYSDALVTTLVAKDRCWPTIPAGRFTAPRGILKTGFKSVQDAQRRNWPRQFMGSPATGRSTDARIFWSTWRRAIHPPMGRRKKCERIWRI